ncbi:MAG: DNA-directed RNA polymerase, subunit E'' [Candidatus Bathyarchaeota archaeon]|nr:MAG: DNA-directed RNA polymerase, subunit E'' [Candidatus Bathyarchaeota archaeon]
MPEQACRTCHLLTTGKICPNCKKANLSRDWVGELVVVDPENSALAKRLNISKPGRFALRVR